MNFVEVNLFGVYVAPISILMVAAYGVLFGARRLAIRLGWLASGWFVGLFELALYVVILSTMVLLAARLHVYV